MKIYKSYFFISHKAHFAIRTYWMIGFLFLLQSLNAQETDYTNLYYWAAHPDKTDPSDSIPLAIKSIYKKDSLTDVFFIHPTTYTTKTFTNWNASVNDEALNKKTDETAILYQASVFNECNRVFAPRYRQANLQAFFIDPKDAKPYFDTAYADIKKAFEYYLSHYGHGQPIIIAAHSQGTVHAARLLKEFFENKALEKQLVCAYIIGMPVPENYFSKLKPCEHSESTGCFVCWRTYKSGYIPSFVKEEKFKSVVVNPLTWTLTDSTAPSFLNKGGVLKNFNKIVPHVVSARIHENILWSCKPNVFGKIFFFKKNFHIGDINLFYMNIRENIQTRLQAFKKQAS